MRKEVPELVSYPFMEEMGIAPIELDPETMDLRSEFRARLRELLKAGWREDADSEEGKEIIKFVRITLPVNAVDLQREYNLPEGFFDLSSARGIIREYLDADGNEDVSWIKDNISQEEREKGR
jgi:hypothetical protein